MQLVHATSGRGCSSDELSMTSGFGEIMTNEVLICSRVHSLVAYWEQTDTTKSVGYGLWCSLTYQTMHATCCVCTSDRHRTLSAMAVL